MISEYDRLFIETAERINYKFKYYWPSYKNNPPTEANITSSLCEVLYSREYLSFTEIPLDLGLIDYMGIKLDDGRVSHLLFAEVKTYVSEKKILIDLDRLSSVRGDKADEFKKLVEVNPAMTVFSLFWTENQQKINRLQVAMNCSVPTNDKFLIKLSQCFYKGIVSVGDSNDFWLAYFGNEI